MRNDLRVETIEGQPIGLRPSMAVDTTHYGTRRTGRRSRLAEQRNVLLMCAHLCFAEPELPNEARLMLPETKQFYLTEIHPRNWNRMRPSRLHMLQKEIHRLRGSHPHLSQTHHRALCAPACCATGGPARDGDARVGALERPDCQTASWPSVRHRGPYACAYESGSEGRGIRRAWRTEHCLGRHRRAASRGSAPAVMPVGGIAAFRTREPPKHFKSDADVIGGRRPRHIIQSARAWQ